MTTYTKIDDDTVNAVEDFGKSEYTISLSDMDTRIKNIETELKNTTDKFIKERLTEEIKELTKFSKMLKELKVK